MANGIKTNDAFGRMWKEVFVNFLIEHFYNLPERTEKTEKIISLCRDYLPLDRDSKPAHLEFEVRLLNTQAQNWVFA
jgi:hypothetical protein